MVEVRPTTGVSQHRRRVNKGASEAPLAPLEPRPRCKIMHGKVYVRRWRGGPWRRGHGTAASSDASEGRFGPNRASAAICFVTVVTGRGGLVVVRCEVRYHHLTGRAGLPAW